MVALAVEIYVTFLNKVLTLVLSSVHVSLMNQCEL